MSLVKKIFSYVIILTVLCFTTISVFASSVICGGDSIGIALNYDGVLITGTYDYSIDNQTFNPISQDIQAGDLITMINSNKIETILELASNIQTSIENSKDIVLTITRNNETLEKKLNVHYDQATETFKTGLYVKDSTIGIGTMTYYDPQNHTFAALGHSLSDKDFDLQFASGTIFESCVNDVVKNNGTKTGEKIAVIEDDKVLGEVVYNNEIGVYGYYYGDVKGIIMETGLIEEATLGKAYLLTVINGQDVEKVEIEITELKPQEKSNQKGIGFTVIDQVFLEKTNGVIQGMSGSPILQNDKIIGAVSHVNGKNPKNGYGVYIEWMLQISNQMEGSRG